MKNLEGATSPAIAAELEEAKADATALEEEKAHFAEVQKEGAIDQALEADKKADNGHLKWWINNADQLPHLQPSPPAYNALVTPYDRLVIVAATCEKAENPLAGSNTVLIVIIIVILVLLLGAVLGWYFLKKRAAAAAEAEDAEDEDEEDNEV